MSPLKVIEAKDGDILCVPDSFCWRRPAAI